MSTRSIIVAIISATVLSMLCSSGSHAEDAALTAIHAELEPLRAHRSEHPETRGATIAFTEIKHQLRDWVDGKIAEVDPNGDFRSLADALNRELLQADLLCESAADVDRCAGDDTTDWNAVGYLGRLRIETQTYPHFISSIAPIGIECGYDESAYVYGWKDGNWRRVIQSEQTEYTKASYLPQFIDAVHISRSERPAGEEHLVLILGQYGWCTSTWYPVFFRLWKISGNPDDTALLLDGQRQAWLGKYDVPIMGSVSLDDALIEFTVGSIDVDVHNRQAVFHYRVDGKKVTRIDPVALNPRDFVDEWLVRDWTDSVIWSDERSRPALRAAHEKFHSGHVIGSFAEDTFRCRDRTDEWQVELALGEPDKEAPPNYFIVRWQPPYHFEMDEVRDEPRPDCTEKVSDHGELDTLFPVQGWR